MSVLSDKIKTLIENQAAIYIRSININDLNQQINTTDIKGAVVGVHSNVPEAENLTYSGTNNVLVNETIEVHYLQLSPIDATGAQTQTILDTLRPYADGLFDLLQGDSLRSQDESIDGYELEAVESVKITNEVLTGWKLSLTFPYYRESFNCNFSPEAQAVLDRMFNLSSKQTNAIVRFVDSEVLAGNWALTDEFYCLALGWPNALQGFKSLTATNYGATFDNTGATFDGVSQFIGSGIIPSANTDRLNDVDTQCFCVENYDTGKDNAILFGAFQSTKKLYMIQRPAANLQINYWVNQVLASVYGVISDFQNNELYGVNRVLNSAAQLYINGLQVDSETDSTADQNDIELFIGASDSNGTAASHINAKLGSFKYGAAIGFDQAAHNTNVRQLLADLV